MANFFTVPEDQVPGRATSTRSEYHQPVQDSFQDQQWRGVEIEGYNDEERHANYKRAENAIRAAGLYHGYGVSVRAVRDDNGVPQGIVFKAQEKRAKAPNGTRSDSEQTTSDESGETPKRRTRKSDQVA